MVLLFTSVVSYSQVSDTFDSLHPDLRLCNPPYSCTANNITVIDVYLALAGSGGTPLLDAISSCNIGQTWSVEIWMEYSKNQSTSIGQTRVQATLVSGSNTYEINKYLGTLSGGKDTSLKVKVSSKVFTWSCGLRLQL